MQPQDIHAGHRARMRTRFMQHGLDSLDDHNVLELLLFYALPRRDTNLLAHRLINAFGSLAGVFDASVEALMTVEGIGETAAGLIRLIPETARRYLISKAEPMDALTDSAAAGRYLIPRFFNCQNETVYMVCLDAAMRILDCRQISQGSAGAAQVSTRQVVQNALRQNATFVILAHNHISGIAMPSQEDCRVTRQLRDALAMVEVGLADHIIVATGVADREDAVEIVSMADAGLLTDE